MRQCELCLELGFPSPEHMHATLTRGQVARWGQFFDQVPIGERRQDMRNALLIANVLKVHGVKDVEVHRYMLPFYPVEEPAEGSLMVKLRGWLARPVPTRRRA